MAFLKGQPSKFKGRKHSEETKQKMSRSHTGFKYTKESRQKMSEVRKGIKFTEEHKRNIGLARIGRPAWNRNVPSSNEARKKISEAQKKRDPTTRVLPKIKFGEEHPNWKGGMGKNRNAYLEKKAGRSRSELCELCDRAGRIVFDHDHKTDKFRGWICHRCNIILGLVFDDEEYLMKLIAYLKESKL